MSDWTQGRDIGKRLIITGNLSLTSPAHFGNGESEGLTDMPLLRDALQQKPLLMGTSIAGALRAYLQARRHGYRCSEQEHKNNVALLFGMVKGDDSEDAEQSPLIIDDAIGQLLPVEVRDGVRINNKTRIASNKAKFDIELLPAGTSFPLRFELLLPKDAAKSQLLQAALVEALSGLELGEIFIGARRSRGFGRCKVSGWRMLSFDLSQPAELVRWLVTDEQNAQAVPELSEATAIQPIAKLLPDIDTRHAIDMRQAFIIEAQFKFASPILIRSEQALLNSDQEPDFIQLRNAADHAIVSGTSLAGTLRARATRILKTLIQDEADRAEKHIDCLFGKDMQRNQIEPTASRFIVEEVLIENSTTFIQNRVAIDRFTGGAFDTALFNEAPEAGGDIALKLTILNPSDADKGLTLLLLKDLSTGDLTLGGASSIGRGRLQGLSATVVQQENGTRQELATITQNESSVVVTGDKGLLEQYVEAVQGANHEPGK